jgi:ribosomal protein L37AE/L43A
MAPPQAVCPHCGTPLVWSYVNQQYYCNRCEIFVQSNQPTTSYANLHSEIQELTGTGSKPKYQNPTCNSCARPLNYVPQYQRWYCYNCQKYA